MAADAVREREIAELARRLAGLGGTRGPRVFALSWWSDHLLARAMADPEFRVHLFRFVDAYPAMSSPDTVVGHLRGEFEGLSVPWWFRLGLAASERVPAGRRIAARVAGRSVDRMARQFVIGTEPDEVAAAVGRMWGQGTAATVDLLGERTHSAAEASRYAARLDAVVEHLGRAAGSWVSQPRLERDDLGPVPRASVSVKVSALSPAFAPLTAEPGLAEAERLLLPVLQRAARSGVSVWFDMERYEEKILTQQLFRRLLERADLEELHAGIVLQAYLRDAEEDLAALASWAQGRRIPPAVRLVKGAYWDTETVEAAALGWDPPVFADKADTDADFERLARQLHACHGTLRAAFASHNLRSLAAAVVDGRAAGVGDDGYELQLLYGMAEPVHEAVRRAGFRLRVYTPMGELIPGMAYLVRRLLENTSNEGFVRVHFAEGAPIDELLAAPGTGPVLGTDPPSGNGTTPPRRRRSRTRPPAPARPPAARSGARARGAPGRHEALLEPYRPEPPAQWHRPEVMAAFEAAVEEEYTRPGRRIGAVVGSNAVGAPATSVSVDPADPTNLVAVVDACGPRQVEAALAVAAEAAGAWRRRPAAERAQVLVRAAQHLRAHRLALAALEVHEVGKGWADADADVCEAIDYCEYYARRMLVLDEGGEVQSPPGEENRLRYHGRGVCAVVAPWNFPLAIPTGMTAAALVAGNAVVLKPAEQAPATAAELVTAFAAAGLPEGVLSFVPGTGEEAGAPLVSHPSVDVLAFTGSRDVGLSIVETVARRDPRRRSVPRVVAEMGGKNAVIVDEDADLDQVVPAVVRSAFGFAGQKCSAASRLVALDRVHDAVVERVVEAARSLVVGPPRHAWSQLGPVVDAASHERLLDVSARLGACGTPVLRRTDIPSSGFFVGPAVVTDVDPESWLANDELFGPVLAVFRVPDFDAALTLANRTDYALTAGVFSRSPSNIRRAQHELRAGNVYVNRAITGAVVGRQPFGGNGMSGVGSKAGGPDYLLQFCDPQVTSENTVRQGFAAARDDVAEDQAEPAPATPRTPRRRR